MTHGSLFSGIGGFDLAAEWMGWDNVFHCEINPFCQTVLKHYWPNAKSYENIKEFDGTIYRGTIDIISGGFPCQPFSLAGKRRGTDDNRYLWPEMLRVIREVKPRWVVGENVYGLVNWDGGLVFEQVCLDLENEGYQVQPVILPACSLNADHKRERIWFVAYSNNYGQSSSKDRQGNIEGSRNYSSWSEAIVEPSGCSCEATTFTSYTNCKRSPKVELQRENSEWEMFRSFSPQGENYRWKHWPTQSPVCSGDDGISSQLDGITFSKWRNESIKGLGNAIVPPVAYEIFKIIEKMETLFRA